MFSICFTIETHYEAVIFNNHSIGQRKKNSSAKTPESSEPAPQVIEKTAEEKQAIVDADAARMDALGLHYDYANLTLPQVVQTYMDEMGIDHANIAFSYKNTKTNEVIAMNETQPMTAGSTYKLPLNMLAVDAVEKENYQWILPMILQILIMNMLGNIRPIVINLVMI